MSNNPKMTPKCLNWTNSKREREAPVLTQLSKALENWTQGDVMLIEPPKNMFVTITSQITEFKFNFIAVTLLLEILERSRFSSRIDSKDSSFWGQTTTGPESMT